MKSRANAFQSEHGGGFTIEIYCGIPGYSAVNRGGGGGGGVSTCLDTRNTAWIGQEFHWETRIFSTWGWETGQKRGGSWRMADGFFNNPRPSLFQSFSWNQAIRKKSWTAVVRMVESLDRKPPLRWLFNYHACFVPPFFLEGKLRTFFFFFFS